jgi:4-amino-4-deoxy-L-arabinose transferase-like glycosyltransferase
MQYIHYVARQGRIPLATDGWQMFQSPFYSLLVAPLYQLLSALLPHQAIWVWRLLRFVSLACGGLQIELSYRTLRYICPTRADLQRLGTVLGGMLPMNIYLSQAIGNEPLAGCLSAVVVMLGIKSLCVPEKALSKWHWPMLGVFLGLAILTKTTAVLLVPLVGMVTVYCFVRAGRGMKRTAVGCVTVFGIAMVISAWYYVRNWIELGSPFVGGWDPSRGIVWWQDPGFRVPKHFFGFGQSLVYPVYSGVCGLWDALYSTMFLDGWLSANCVYELRPPWNYAAMNSGAWLAILPAVGMAIGIASALCCPRRVAEGGLRFAVACIATYLLALILLYLQLPIYSTAKATYTVRLIPCYAAVGAVGLSYLMRGPLSRAAISGWTACWAASAYMAYFVL